MPMVATIQLADENGTGAPRRRNRRGAATRETLVDATIQCLDRLGYPATSIEEVMKVSGIGRGSVLNQFPTRLDLMIAAAGEAMNRMLEHARSSLSEIPDPHERLFRHAEIAWVTHNLSEATALTEILLASRREESLATALRPVAESVERGLDRMHVALARNAGIEQVTDFLVRGRLLNSSLRGLTIELMFNRDREMILGAVESLKADHVRYCESLLPER